MGKRVGRIEADDTSVSYQTIVESSADAIFIVGRDMRLRYANEAASIMLRRPVDDIVGRPLADLFSAETAEHERVAIERTISSGEAQMSEIAIAFPSRRIWQHVSLVPIKNESGEFDAAIGFARDITDLKNAEQAVLESEERYRALVEAVGDVVFVIGRDDRVQYVNNGAAQWLRKSPDALIGKERAELFPEDTEWGRTQARNLRTVLDTGASFYVENVARFPEGSRWQGTSLAPVRDSEGRTIAVLGIGRDITKRKIAEEALTTTNEELAARLGEIERLSSQVSALNRMGQMLLGCRAPKEVYDVFASFAGELFPGTAGGLAMRDESDQAITTVAEWGDAGALEEVFAPDDCWALRLGRNHLAEKHGVPDVHVALGESDSSLCIPLSAQGETRGVLTILSAGEVNLRQDIMQQHAMSVAEQMALAFANVNLRIELEEQAVHDPLTGLYNRRFLDETLLRELHRGARKSEPVAVIMFDVDHFKRFNDQCGHAAGDEVLRGLGHAAREASRAEDVACRYGGDEIVLVLPGASTQEAVERANEIRKRIEGLPLTVPCRDAPALTMSAGVAAYPASGAEPEEILAAADRALYRAKAEGRDRVEVARD